MLVRQRLSIYQGQASRTHEVISLLQLLLDRRLALNTPVNDIALDTVGLKVEARYRVPRGGFVKPTAQSQQGLPTGLS